MLRPFDMPIGIDTSSWKCYLADNSRKGREGLDYKTATYLPASIDFELNLCDIASVDF